MMSLPFKDQLVKKGVESFLRFMMGRVRVLPLVFFCAVTLLSVKISSLWTTLHHKDAFLSVGSEAVAEEIRTSPPSQIEKVTHKEEKTQSPQRTAAPEKVSSTAQDPQLQKLADLDPTKTSAAEYRALQSVAASKKENGTIQADPQKEATLKAIEARIDEKSQKLKESYEKLNQLLKNVEEQENTDTMRLVKIAEGMKPAEAAKILEGINFDILLEIMSKIKENKAAPILSKMEPQKASYLITELAIRKKLLKKKELGENQKKIDASSAT